MFLAHDTTDFSGKNSIRDCKIASDAADASVAQGIEQRFPVPCVGGSIPSRRVVSAADGAVIA